MQRMSWRICAGIDLRKTFAKRLYKHSLWDEVERTHRCRANCTYKTVRTKIWHVSNGRDQNLARIRQSGPESVTYKTAMTRSGTYKTVRTRTWSWREGQTTSNLPGVQISLGSAAVKPLSLGHSGYEDIQPEWGRAAPHPDNLMWKEF